MAQNIKITIAGRPYSITALSADHEEIIRKAAAEVNQKISEHQEMFPNKVLIEILSLMVLNTNIANILLQKKVERITDAEKGLANELERYLENIDKVSRSLHFC